jgi:PilZ domain/Putative zinc-finger
MLDQFKQPLAAIPRDIEARNAERRREARYPTQDPAELEILPGPSEPIYGTILDVSRSGLRVALRERIGRGEQVMVKLHRNVIFGEVRYCRPVPGGFHLGVKIQDLVRAPGRQDEHIVDDQISLYAVGKGLTVAEVIEVREHLAQCETCRACLAQREDMLNHGASHRGRLSIHPSD